MAICEAIRKMFPPIAFFPLSHPLCDTLEIPYGVIAGPGMISKPVLSLEEADIAIAEVRSGALPDDGASSIRWDLEAGGMKRWIEIDSRLRDYPIPEPSAKRTALSWSAVKSPSDPFQPFALTERVKGLDRVRADVYAPIVDHRRAAFSALAQLHERHVITVSQALEFYRMLGQIDLPMDRTDLLERFRALDADAKKAWETRFCNWLCDSRHQYGDEWRAVLVGYPVEEITLTGEGVYTIAYKDGVTGIVRRHNRGWPARKGIVS